MDTWTAIRTVFCKRSDPGSMGRMIAINEAMDLFVLLRKNNLIADTEASELALNRDEEIKPAIMSRKSIQLLRDDRVIR